MPHLCRVRRSMTTHLLTVRVEPTGNASIILTDRSSVVVIMSAISLLHERLMAHDRKSRVIAALPMVLGCDPLVGLVVKLDRLAATLACYAIGDIIQCGFKRLSLIVHLRIPFVSQSGRAFARPLVSLVPRCQVHHWPYPNCLARLPCQAIPDRARRSSRSPEARSTRCQGFRLPRWLVDHARLAASLRACCR